MITPVNNNFSPLPFYESSNVPMDTEYLQQNKPYAYGVAFDLPIAEGWVMPFQFKVDFVVASIANTSRVVPVANPANAQSFATLPVVVTEAGDTASTIIYSGGQFANLPVGRCYVKLDLVDGSNVTHTYISDIFSNVIETQSNVKKVPKGYVRIAYGNDHVLKYNGGQIYFADHKLEFDVLVDATICKPRYSFEEKAISRLGYDYIESQISKKTYGFTFVAPEYLCDALRLLPMCNVRTISDSLNVYDKIDSISVEVEWLEQGDLAQVTIMFNNDTVVANLAEYVSVAPRRLNTTLPLPPTPEITRPIVTLNDITDIQQTQASFNAEVVSDGGGTLTERGLCWSATSSTPTISDSHLASTQAEIGTFDLTITGLTAKTYYVRAYATNEMGTAYSDTVTINMLPNDQLPIVMTYGAQNVLDTSAEVSGSVISEGTQPVQQRGIVFSSTNQQPQIGDNDVSVVVYAGGGSGAFSWIQQLQHLTAGTTYYYRAFAISAVGTAYGDGMDFTTKGVLCDPPTIVTDETPRNITAGGATLGGTLISSGGGTVTERGIVLGTTSTPTTSDTKIVANGTGLGTYYLDVTCLVANTHYYYRAYAINEAGTAYGNAGDFTTLNNAAVPSVEFDQYDLYTNRIRLDAHVTNDNGAAVTEMGFVYSTSQSNPTLNNASHIVAGQVSGYSFGDEITGLSPNTLYYCRAYAKNSVGTGYSNVIALTTLQQQASVPTVTVEQVNPTAAVRDVTFDGNVTSDGGAVVTQRGICWSDTNAAPTVNDNNAPAATGGTGTFQVTVATATFKQGLKYFYRAYAVNSVGVGYSTVKTFDIPVVVSPDPPVEEEVR